VKDSSKRRRNTYAGIRRPTIGEGSDSSVPNDSPVRAGSEGKTSEVHTAAQETLSSQLPKQETEVNLEIKRSSDISAAVSPRTTTDDAPVQHLISPMAVEHDEKEPLTATRITMDIEKDIQNHINGQNNDSRSPPRGLLQTTSADTRNYNENLSTPNDNSMSPDCVGLINRKNHEDMRPDMSMLSMYSSTFSNMRTPLQTPQLSSSMSTPQMDTPEQPDFHAYGLGVQIPMQGVGLSFGVQSLMDHHMMGGIPHSIPDATSNSLRTPTSAISHPNTQSSQAGHSNLDLTLHHKLDSFPHMNAAGVSDSATFTDCNPNSNHTLSGLNEDMLTGIDVSMSMALDMDNGGGVATNAMALHPFTWA
jgi:hypothetical protein